MGAAMWQNLAAGTIVALAGLYALWYWMPAALRKRLARIRPALGKAPSCGSCSDCGGCATPLSPGAQSGGGKTIWMAPRR